ncbi:MAG: T9SS type A sorting domain-containing protein, partial [bacterium]
NYMLHPGIVNQTEVFITKSPVDDNVLFASCNTLTFVPFFLSEGIFVTANGGANWRGNDTCTGNPIDYHGGDVGITIDRNGTFLLTRLGRAPFVGLYSHYSNDNGLTWSSQQVISTNDLERASLVSDARKNSSFYGRSYAVWTTFATPFPLMVASTDDGGKKWTAQKQVNQPPNRCAGGDVAVGPNGEVYACWAGVTAISPFKEIFVGFGASEDGGATWTVLENAFNMSGISGVLPGKNNIRVNSLPVITVDTTTGPRKGWIYIVTCQKGLSPAGSDPDIVMYRSADRGHTWSSGIRVNQDPLNNGKTQFFPAVHVDKTGAIDIIFYDDRNTSTDSAGVFLARSQDGGDNWHEYEISDHNFMPKPIGGLGQGYQGDNIDITSTTTKLWPVWMDNSSGIYQVWTVPIDYADVNAIGEKEPGNSFTLGQNQPNPFSEVTSIPFHLSKKGFVSLEVSDILGRPVAKLVDETLSAGSYTRDFNMSKLAGKGNLVSGIFFLQLTVDGVSVTRRMLFVK